MCLTILVIYSKNWNLATTYFQTFPKSTLLMTENHNSVYGVVDKIYCILITVHLVLGSCIVHFKSLVTKNAWVKEFLHLCGENSINWIFGLFLKMRKSKNCTTEIRKNQWPGVTLNLGHFTHCTFPMHKIKLES